MEAIDLTMKKLVNRNAVLEKRLKAMQTTYKASKVVLEEVKRMYKELQESIKKNKDAAEGAETEDEVTPCGFCGHENIWGGDDDECEGCGPGGHTCPCTALPVAECGCADCTPEEEKEGAQ